MTMKTDLNLGTGIKFPPPIIYLAALIIGVVVDDFWPFSPLPEIWGEIVGSVLILVSFLLVPTFLIRFKCSSGLEENQKCLVILADGIRNYLGKFVSDDWMKENGFNI